MKRKCVLLVLMFCLIIGGNIPLTIVAAQDSNIIQSVEIESPNIFIRCANIEENSEYTVKLGKESLQVVQETVEEKNIPVTVFCLVDTSGSISSFKKTLICDTLLEISSSMNEQDSMVIAEVNNQISIGEPLFLQEDREAAIKRISASSKDTNLYAGIVQSINQILSNETYNPYTCLVILSDGEDYQDNGFTEYEVLEAVRESHIPVFTVALVQNSAEREEAKKMGSFARASYGGEHLTTVGEGGNEPIRNDVSGKEFGKTIWEKLMLTTYLTAKVENLGQNEVTSSAVLTVQCKSGENIYEDFASISYSDLNIADVPIPEPKEETPINEPESTEKNVQEKPLKVKYTYLWVALFLTGILIVVLIALFVKKKLREKKADIGQEENSLNLFEDKPGNTSPELTVPQKESIQKYRVFVTDIPYGMRKICLTMQEGQSISFGRNAQSDYILNAKDNKVSGRHFSLHVKNGIYNVRDEGSLNGTYLNGVKIKGQSWTKLETADKVKAGSQEYRINIDPIRE